MPFAQPESSEIITLGARELAQRVASGALSASAVARAFLARIATVENKIHAWESLDRAYVAAQAEAIDRRVTAGEAPGPLTGVPLGVKDVINTLVLPTRMGSPLWKDHAAGNDARIVAQLRWAGAVVLGKTVTAEFAVHAPGPTRNPHHLGRTPGTSSMGSAAAVAAAMTPAALGTQTAGSLIRPASFCGIYAFKPTFGWLPRTGVLKTTDTLDQIGFHARCVEDLRPLFEAGRVGGRNHPLKEEQLARFPEKGSWRVGLAKTHLWEEAPIYARDALVQFVERVRGERIEVVATELPPSFRDAHAIHGTIYDCDLSYYFRNEMHIDESQLSSQLREIIRRGREVPAEAYRGALRQQVALVQMLDELFERERLDALLSLSSNGEAPAVEPVPFRDPCALYTLCGVPTLNLPVFTGPTGLPFGAQLVGRKYADRLLLGLAEYLAAAEILRPSRIATPAG